MPHMGEWRWSGPAKKIWLGEVVELRGPWGQSRFMRAYGFSWGSRFIGRLRPDR